MPDITATTDQPDAIRGVTLRERAQLVLLTLGRTPAAITRAFRRMAKRHHPDTGGDTLEFKVINEAYQLLANGRTSKKPLLADDDLIIKITGRKVAALLTRQKDWDVYTRHHHNRFHDGDWLYPEPSQRKPQKRTRK